MLIETGSGFGVKSISKLPYLEVSKHAHSFIWNINYLKENATRLGGLETMFSFKLF